MSRRRVTVEEQQANTLTRDATPTVSKTHFTWSRTVSGDSYGWLAMSLLETTLLGRAGGI
ncbi:MAG: hypothetical protein J2P17_32735 [Mycobacterium sp.]|nr:hypothetical protein [Mycobacterium sp.]